MPLPPDPELAALAAARKAIKRSNPPKAPCDECDEKFSDAGALRFHKAEVHPVGRFTPKLQEDYLRLIRNGGTIHKSARAIGLTPEIVLRHTRTFPNFADSVQIAEEEAAEDIEIGFRQAAVDTEPWATKEWMKKRSPKRWADAPQQVQVDVNGKITHELRAGDPHARALELTQRAMARKALAEGSAEPEIIDAEVIDE